MLPVTRFASQPAQPILAVPVADIVKQIALACLKELSLTLAFGTAVSFFVTTPSGLALLFSAALVQFTVSLFFHSLGAYSSYKIGQRVPNSTSFERILSLCEWVTGANFGFFTGFNTQTLIHETGHTLAALAVFKNPRPQIEIYPFIGGLTQFYKTAPSSWGKKIGPVAMTCFVIASGPTLTLLASSALLAIGLAIKEKYPQFGKYLIAWSYLDFLNHAHYAYSALRADPSNLAHDFVHLSIFGLHPVVATIGILAVPIVITAGMYFWQKQN